VEEKQYLCELQGLLSQVLKCYQKFATEEFLEVCKAAQLPELLERVEEQCTAQGVIGGFSDAAAHWQAPASQSPLVVARTQRLALKREEQARLTHMLKEAENASSTGEASVKRLREELHAQVDTLSQTSDALSLVNIASRCVNFNILFNKF